MTSWRGRRIKTRCGRPANRSAWAAGPQARYYNPVLQRGRMKGMRVTSKGQVTIPQAVRQALGIEPGSEVEFELDDGGARLVRCKTSKGRVRAAQMRGRGAVKLTTDEIMALTRGEP